MNPQQTMQQYGKNYYLATQFFPREVRQDIYLIYYLVRIPDLIVDQPGLDDIATAQKLNNLLTQRKKAYYHKHNNQFTRVAQLFHRKKIDPQLVEDFWEAMLMDTNVKRYQTYSQLQSYMYGSAEVVWLMMCQLFDTDHKAYAHAQALGEAMQLTNFLRDIHEDYVDLWRIYLPLDILQKHWLTHDDVIDNISRHKTDPLSPALHNAIAELWQICQKQYDYAHQWLHYLPDYARRAVHIASLLYQWIGHKIVKNNYDSIIHDCHTTKREKMIIIINHLRDRTRQRIRGK